MKKIIISTLLLAGIFSCSSDQNVAKTQKKSAKEISKSEDGVNLQDSKVYWFASKATGGNHSGEVSFKSAKFNWENGNIVNGSFSIDMNSITCSDIKDAESNQDLVNHLKSGDFFAVEEFPTTNVEILEVVIDENGGYSSAMEFTIKGIKKVVPVNFIVTEGNGNKIVSGRLKINRTDFGVVYNSSNFFKSLGDKVINDDVYFKFSIILK